jgi:hypothetical protein
LPFQLDTFAFDCATGFMNDYDDYENDYNQLHSSLADEPLFLSADDAVLHQADVDFDDEKIAALPRIILMGPRRGGKTSIQVS